MPNDTKELQKTELPMSVRFMEHVVQEYGHGVGEVALTNFQKRLAQNYFMAVDDALVKTEERRNKQKNATPAAWSNINMSRLAQDVVSLARIGLDPNENNHISPVLFKNNRTGKYDVGFITRYKGLEMKAKKYGLDCPDSVIVELVYSTDKFKSIKRSADNNVEKYEFEITNEFDRGDIVGGFFYHVYTSNPEKNKLVVMSKKDIDKRKPKYASNEFWGKDGWYEKMAYKTLHRAAYSAVTIDSQKIDDDYRRLSAAENMSSGADFEAEYQEQANSTPLADDGPIVDAEFSEGEVVDENTGEVTNTHESAGEEEPPFPVG